jgi:hypothetical protein
MLITNVWLHDFAVSCVAQDLTTKFSWKMVVVYGSPYEDKKCTFIDELHSILARWQGPCWRVTLICVGSLHIKVMGGLIKNLLIVLMIGLINGFD